MARIRRAEEQKKPPRQHVWKVGKYIRLSREDGNEVSESVVNQDKILTDELPKFFADGGYELVDAYIDDGTSGTTDVEREAFQRMVRDVETGRIDCIIVKNLSRAFRNSANQGKFLEEFIPLYHTRFISLYQPKLDTFLDPEIVHSLEVSITGFMNEQYAYKTSCDVRRTFKIKREKGEFIGAFAPYGYAKAADNKNRLVIDEDAAAVVRDIYAWFARDGMSKSGIARRLNELGVPNPTAYKRGRGIRFHSPGSGKNDGLWSPTTISSILQNPLYIGTLRQGRQRMVSYKVHRAVSVPESEWFVVENAVPPIVERRIFDAAQELHRRDTRTIAQRREPYLFSGFLYCADCGKGMHRHTAKGYAYYACRTHREKTPAACGRHSIRQDRLETSVLLSLRRQVDLALELENVIDGINRAPAAQRASERLNAQLKQKSGELDASRERLDGVYFDWKQGDVSHEQYLRLKQTLETQVAQLQEVVERLRSECAEAIRHCGGEDPQLEAFVKYRGIQCLTRGLLIELVDAVSVRKDGSIELALNYEDPFCRIAERGKDGGGALRDPGGQVG